MPTWAVDMSQKTTADVVVIGGGIIGTAAAYF
jgi:glycine/D-amino acid oxidase-like deaminating enzyme